MINFISHEEFPDDPYIKELVYLQIDPQSRIAYVRKPMKNGGMFWSPMSCAITKNGAKKYYDSIDLDSSFLKKDILAFLEARSWEQKTIDASIATYAIYKPALHSQPAYSVISHPGVAGNIQSSSIVNIPPAQMSFSDDLPF